MTEDHLDATFASLADPTRRAILARLAQGEATVNELAEPFEMSLPAISRHLKVLERAGLISRGREAQWRPCRLEAGPLKDIANWVERYRRFWDQSFDRMADYLKELQTPRETRMTARTDTVAAQSLVLEFSRVFDAPPALVFRMWSSPEHLCRWWGRRALRRAARRTSSVTAAATICSFMATSRMA